MAVNWTRAEPPDRISRWLIDEFHPKLKDLSVQIVFLFRDDLPKSQGAEQWFDVRKVSGLNAWLAQLGIKNVGDLPAQLPSAAPTAEMDDYDEDDGGEETAWAEPFFVVWFALPVWDRLADRERMAMVDAALCKCGSGRNERSGNVELNKKRPDLEIHFANIERFGTWFEAAEKAAAVVASGGQVGLPMDLGPLNARVSAQQATAVASGEPAAAESAELSGELGAALSEPEPGTPEDAAEHEAMRTFQDVAEEVMEADPQRFPPALTTVEGGAPKRGGRRKPPEEIATPNPAGFRDHVDARRVDHLSGAAGS